MQPTTSDDWNQRHPLGQTDLNVSRIGIGSSYGVGAAGLIMNTESTIFIGERSENPTSEQEYKILHSDIETILLLPCRPTVESAHLSNTACIEHFVN